MRLILNILVLPIILVLTLLTAVLGFLVALAGWPSIIASILGILSFITLVTGGGTAAGIGGMVIAFLISPFGLPAVAGWIIEKLADLNYSLKCFLTD